MAVVESLLVAFLVVLSWDLQGRHGASHDHSSWGVVSLHGSWLEDRKLSDALVKHCFFLEEKEKLDF